MAKKRQIAIQHKNNLFRLKGDDETSVAALWWWYRLHGLTRERKSNIDWIISRWTRPLLSIRFFYFKLCMWHIHLPSIMIFIFFSSPFVHMFPEFELYNKKKKERKKKKKIVWLKRTNGEDDREKKWQYIYVANQMTLWQWNKKMSHILSALNAIAQK
jgi:hypothetical protein